MQFENTNFALRRISTDTRKLQPGEVFWALRGERHDGHRFVPQAAEIGALFCVVDEDADLATTGPCVVVNNTQRALWDFARWYRQQREAMVIGVTGSVGKTTTREMIHAVLSAEHQGTRSHGNFNNEIGLPLSLLDIDGHHDFAVVEMGARRVGEIAALAEIAAPEVGVITKIGPSHLETFGSLEKITEAKGELFEALPCPGFAVLPGDDPLTRSLAMRAACPVILVGTGSENHLRATAVEANASGLTFIVDGWRYETPLIGRHSLTAALCAVAIGREIGMHPAAIAHGLKHFESPPGRCRLERCGEWTVIDDTYNANPSSMQAACHLLEDWRGANKKLLIAGDMLELGDHAVACHRELGAQAARAKVDRLLAFGPHAEHVIAGALEAGFDSHFLAECPSLEALLAVLDCWLGPGDVVLVKGSRGMQMERVVDWLHHRAEREHEGDDARLLRRACA